MQKTLSQKLSCLVPGVQSNPVTEIVVSRSRGAVHLTNCTMNGAVIRLCLRRAIRQLVRRHRNSPSFWSGSGTDDGRAAHSSKDGGCSGAEGRRSLRLSAIYREA